MARSANPQKRAQWRQRLGRFARSELTVAEFCRREGVSVPAFYQWRRRLAESSSDNGKGGRPARASFLPVQITQDAGVHVAFPNGARLTLPSGDRDLIRLTIKLIAAARTASGGA
jgi:hypothetical protein